MKYKALISDFDGTLFSSDGRIPQENVDAIGEFVSRGGKFALCSGRMTASAIVMLEKFPFNQLIAAYNGCEVWDNVNKKTLFSTGVKTELALKIVGFGKSEGLLPFVYRGNEAFTETRTEFSDFYAETCKIKMVAVGDLSSFIKNDSLVSPKVMLAGLPNQISEGLKKSTELFGTECEIAESYRGMLDFMPKGCDKGLAVKALAKIWGIGTEECVAIGDELNDAPMLAAAGLGVAMKNGREELKKIADAVTDKSNDEGGVGETIRRYCL